jgi:UDP-glucose 4-epimerase
VGDVVRANLSALKRGSGEIYAIGTGRKTSVNAIYDALCTVGGFSAPIQHAPRRPGDIRDAYFDPAKAARELDWTAEMDLPSGIRATFEHFHEKNSIALT